MIRATSINRDGKNNYQSDCSGHRQQIIERWEHEVEARNILWSHLFAEIDGELIGSYQNGMFSYLKQEENGQAKLVEKILDIYNMAGSVNTDNFNDDEIVTILDQALDDIKDLCESENE